MPKYLIQLASTSVLLLLTLALVPTASAQTLDNTCRYSSTQSRVKRLGFQPWEQQLSLRCGEAFEVGGFHDHTGNYASDTKIRITGPYFDAGKIDGKPIANGQQFQTAVIPGHNYQYTVRVRTRGMDGGACEDYSYVNVHCPAPTPTPTVQPTPSSTPTPEACHYSSTQARVKHDSRDTAKDQHWHQELRIKCFEAFEVGGFHDHTGQYADDVKLRVEGPYMNWNKFQNGDRVNVAFPGEYRLYVTTKGQRGETCQDMAKVQVRCDWNWPR